MPDVVNKVGLENCTTQMEQLMSVKSLLMTVDEL